MNKEQALRKLWKIYSNCVVQILGKMTEVSTTMYIYRRTSKYTLVYV